MIWSRFPYNLLPSLNKVSRLKVHSLADWERYKTIIERELGQVSSIDVQQLVEKSQIDFYIDALTDAMKNGQNEAIPLISPGRYVLNIR